MKKDVDSEGRLVSQEKAVERKPLKLNIFIEKRRVF